MGPLISTFAADHVLIAQDSLIKLGGRALLPAERLSLGPAFLSPGLIDMTDATQTDREIFGPLLQVRRVSDFEAAIKAANETSSGLAAGLVATDPRLYEVFKQRVHAGILAWNQQLTGATGLAPFGGLKNSGNHRPSGFLATDYCTQAIAALERDSVMLPESLSPGLTLTPRS